MSSDAVSTYSFSSTAPLRGSGSPKSPSPLSKLLRRSPSPTNKPTRPASPPKTKSSEETFREIMALNASHGDPSVQAYHLKTTPKPKSPKHSKSASATPSPPRSPFASPEESKRDTFTEIMALNAKHGDPSVQAYFVK